MTTVFDVTYFILSYEGEMTALKLIKLCYYSYVWHLLWEEKPLFNESIYANKLGAVIPELYDLLKGKFKVSKEDIPQHNQLTATEKPNIIIVLDYYRKWTAQQLTEINKQEDPWKLAIKSNDNKITDSSIIEYHSSLED
jgi:uncharacterized phage-associated protein